MEIIEQQRPKHWGSYDGVDHGFDSRAQSPVSRPEQTYPYEQLRGPGVDPADPVAMDPSAPVNWEALFQAEHRGALQYVRSELQAAVLYSLSTTAFQPSSTDGSQGTVVPYLSTTGMPWVDQAVANGKAVLVALGSVASGQPVFDILGQPDAVAALARAGGPSAIVAIPPGVEALAQQSAMQPQTPPVVMPATPSGTIPWKGVAIGVSVLGGGLLLAGLVWPGAARSKR
ncbi:MAG: hypothetical protein JRD89_02305 [Deltaproteobacteria bacterium]|nr:hypothetical protein [Deltaproteobacteria bacterium]